jgi:hypothetical protein
MRVIPLSELKGKTVKGIHDPCDGQLFVACEDNTVVILGSNGGLILDDFESRRVPSVQRLLLKHGLVTEDEIMADIAAEEREKDLLQYNALKAKLGL